MKNLVEIAQKKLGDLSEGRKYCFKMPPVLGGSYTSDNIGDISFLELIGFSGDLAFQIKDLPDGTEIKISFND